MGPARGSDRPGPPSTGQRSTGRSLPGLRRVRRDRAVGAVAVGAEAFTAAAGGVDATGVLLLHGFTGSPSSLRPIAEAAAAAGHAVRLPLLPGHGTHWRNLDATGWPDWTAAAEAALDDIARVCDRVVVVGHSNGGALALHLAARRPAAVAGLVLVNPAVLLVDPRQPFLPVIRRLIPSVAGVAGDVALAGVHVVGYDRTPLAALASMTAGWRVLRGELPAVRCPLLLIRSRVDHVIDASSSRAVLSRVSSRDREVVVLDRSFHEAPVDHDGPEVTARTLAFVGRMATPPGAAASHQAG